jgi:hypothetical protein
MELLDKAKAAADQAVSRAKEKAGELQTKRDLGQAYVELGHKSFELVEAGELSAPTLDPIVERIRTLEAELVQGKAQPGPAPATETAEPSEPSPPPDPTV